MTAGALIGGFEILECVELAEFNAKGVWARHRASGAEVFHIHNDDEENLFAFAFATAAANSTGVAHILEHSVLCGSKKYPLKDPFIVLAQGSLQTYLNAWTLPDKTIYPASSVNEADYFNLMSVYGDAVFRPNLDEWTFMQEGHRLEFDRAAKSAGKLAVTGVVYNEMKGAYSSLDDFIQHCSLKTLLPDTIYAHDSGGDPDEIPSLTYEDFCAFHREYYVPANCRVFLCGNISTEKQLAFLDEHFFSNLAGGRRAPLVEKAARWDAPCSMTVAAPKDADGTMAVFVSWLCGRPDDANDTAQLELFALTEVLLGHDGSPLLRALIESGLGEDLATVSGVDIELREPFFAAGLRGVARETDPRAIENLVMDELRRLARDGIPRSEVEAALLSLEFSNREIRRPGGPWALVLMRRSLRGWMNGAKPWEPVLFNAPFAALKENIAVHPRFFEDLIEERLLANPHRALVCVKPEDNFLAEHELQRGARLAALSAALSWKERAAIRKKNRALAKKQSERDSPRALAQIPHIGVAQLSREIEQVPLNFHAVDGVPVASTRLWTNGISYFNICFPADVLSDDEYHWLPLFCHCVPALGVPGMNYAEVSSLLARTAGDFYAMPGLIAAVPGTDALVETPCGALPLRDRDWVMFRLKCLDEKAAPSLDLALRLIREADFSNERRLSDLILEYKNDVESSLAPHGNVFAGIRAASSASPVKARLEILSGLTQFEFARSVAARPVSEIARALTAIRAKILAAGLLVHYCGEAESGAFAALAPFAAFGAPVSCSAPRTPPRAPLSNIEVFSSPALQIGFAAMNFAAAAFCEPAQMREQALAHHLSTGALWETIRMKGGAYGARCSLDAVEQCWTFSTYRDPKPEASLGVFPRVLARAARMPPSEAVLGKVITGSYAKIKQPHTGAQKGFGELFRLLSGITREMRAARLNTLLNLNGAELAAAAAELARRTASPRKVIITSEHDAESLAQKLGCNVHKLSLEPAGKV